MFIVFKRQTFLKGLMVLMVSIILLFGIGGANVSPVFFDKSIRKVPIYEVKTEDNVVALTFDAAWGADKTEKIIEILNQYNVKATFFLVGFWIDKYPDMVKEIDKNGLLIGNHSKNHLNMPKLSVDEMHKEFEYVNEKVKELTGKQPKFFRAPFGDYDDKLLEEAKNCGLVPVQWSVDSLDWKGISSKEIIARVTTKIGKGKIVLFHNNSDHILEALPTILTTLKNKGYKIVTLDKLIYDDDYIINNSGVQIKNS